MEFRMHEEHGSYAASAARRMREIEQVQRQNAASNIRANLIDAIERGLLSSRDATPDLFPRNADLRAAAIVCAQFIWG